MTLVYLVLAYGLGVALGFSTWRLGWTGCETPAWLWLAPLALLPFTPRLNRAQPSTASLRWPAEAGFVPPAPPGLTPGLAAALALCLLAGALRYAAHPLTPCWTPHDLAAHNLPAGRAFDHSAPQVTVEGVISAYPTVEDSRQRLVLAAHTLTAGGVTRPVEGQLRVNAGIRTRYRYGDTLRVTGRLTTPPDFEDFSYREYLARRGVHSQMAGVRVEPVDAPRAGIPLLRAVYDLRARGEALINRQLPEPYAALANGMLLGIEAGIPDDLYDQFNATGASHVIVISGSNVALLAGVLLAAGGRLLGRQRAVLPALAGVAAFALLVGGDAAVARAALMGGMVIVAAALGRRSTALVSLAAAAGAMALLHPLILWDIGFQLSAAATAGLILLSPGLTCAFRRLWPRFTGGLLTASPTMAGSAGSTVRGLLEDGLVLTLAASLATFPLTAYHFGRFSLIGLFTNLLIAPVQPAILLAGSAAVLLGAAGLTSLSQALFWLPWLALGWTVLAVRWTAALPGAGVAVEGFGLPALLAAYGLLAAALWRSRLAAALRAWRLTPVRLTAPATATAAAAVALLVWAAALSQPDGRLHLYFLDVGQGDGVLIQTPSGRQALIDGGASPQALFAELGAAMPFWDRSLDLLLLTHPDADHMAAQVELPRRFAVGQAVSTPYVMADEAAAPWRDALAAADIPLAAQGRGGWIDLGDGVALWVLWPDESPSTGGQADNDSSLVVRLVYGSFSALLTGDAGSAAEAELLAQGAPLSAAVLKVAHHGSKGSTTPAFVQAINPVLAIIQVGLSNDYGHPHADTLAALQGRTLLRTDEQGRVHIATDGGRMWVESERRPAKF